MRRTILQSVTFLLLLLLAAGALADTSRGGDDLSWDPRFSLPGFNGPVHAAVVWEGRLYLGGEFSELAGEPCQNLACWDGNEWSYPFAGIENPPRIYTMIVHDDELVLGTYWGVHRWNGETLTQYTDQPSGRVYALARWNGLLVAGGDFWYNQSQSRTLHNVAVLQAGGWHPFGTGTNGDVNALAVWDGELVIGGDFTIADGHVADGVARWHEGTFWHMTYPGPALKSSPDKSTSVEALFVHDGALWVGGQFGSLETSALASLARWDGSWHEVDGGVEGRVTCLAPMAGGLFVGGEFTAAGGTPATNAALHDGSGWTALGEIDRWPEAAADYDGDLWVVGYLECLEGDLISPFAGLWSDGAWAPPPLTDGSGIGGSVRALVRYGDLIVAGGSFDAAGRSPAQNLSAWDGTAWSWIADPPPDRPVTELGTWGDRLVVAGDFTWIGGVQADGLALWDGASWEGITGLDGDVHALAEYRDELVIGGAFDTVDGVPASRIARYDGTEWRALAAGLDDDCHALLARHGRLLAGGEFTTAGDLPAEHLAVWDGWNWLEYGGGADGDVRALAEYGDDLLIGGYFDTVGGVESKRVARKSGHDWLPLGECFHGEVCYWMGPDDYVCETTAVTSLAVLGDRVFAGGSILRSGQVDTPGVACWHPDEGWTALGTGVISTWDLLLSESVLFVAGRRYGYPSLSGLNAWHEPAVTSTPSAVSAPLRFERPRPNPFNPSTEFRFTLHEAGAARLAIHDLRGRCLRVLHEGRLHEGDHVFDWDGRDARGARTASGVYMAVLEADGRRAVRKVVMSK